MLVRLSGGLAQRERARNQVGGREAAKIPDHQEDGRDTDQEGEADAQGDVHAVNDWGMVTAQPVLLFRGRNRRPDKRTTCRLKVCT